MAEGNVSTFGRQVVRERNRRGWSLRELAAHASMPLSRVHRIETNPDRPVSFEDAVSLAAAFGIPTSWLIRGAVVRERVLSAARATDSDSAVEAVDVIVHVLELADQLDGMDPAGVAVFTAGEFPRAKNDAAAAWGKRTADLVREKAGRPTGSIEDLPEFIEKHIGAMVVVDSLPEDVDGLSLRDPDSGNAVVAASMNPHWERQRFTLAHELGHILAGDMVIEGFTPGDRRSVSEVAANEFARNLLVPVGDIQAARLQRGEWSERAIAEMAWAYRVSPGVVGIQLERAGLGSQALTQRVSRVSAEAWSEIGGWAPERESLCAAANSRRIPRNLALRALEAWQQGWIPVATLARLHGTDSASMGRRLAALGIEPQLAAPEPVEPAFT